MQTHFAWAWLLLVSLTACGGDEVIRGNGQLVTTTRSAPPFSGVSISDGLRAEVDVGAQTVTLLVDDNVAPHVRTDVEAGALVVGEDEGFDLLPSPGAVARIVSPTIEALEASGSSIVTATTNGANVTLAASGTATITAETTAASSVSIDAAGAGHIHLSGVGPRLVIDASEASKVESDVAGEDAEITANGASVVTVHASTKVRIRASGTSVVTVIGNPATRDVESSGEASVVFSE
jgi:cytoskeletal protein CcmA (bactofilin family)